MNRLTSTTCLIARWLISSSCFSVSPRSPRRSRTPLLTFWNAQVLPLTYTSSTEKQERMPASDRRGSSCFPAPSGLETSAWQPCSQSNAKMSHPP